MSVRWIPTLAVFLLTASPGSAVAQQPDQRVVVAQSTSPAAMFAARPADRKVFDVLPANAELSSGDLLVTMAGASLDSKNGAVSIKSLSDYEGRSPLPILETALTLHVPKEADLDFTLDRGRVDISNKKAGGSAVVRVRFWKQEWTITLDAPGDRVALALCGRWPSGSRFKPADPKNPDDLSEPVASLLLLVLKGSAAIDMGDVTLGLKAPPGPAMMEWDSLAGTRPQPLKLDALPAWANLDSNLTPQGQAFADAVERFRAARALNADGAIDTFLTSPNQADQKIALIALGALDDLSRLGRTLMEAKTLQEWDSGITILRHWLGRTRGQDQKLYVELTAARGYTQSQARTVVQLLFGFTPEERTQPETFEVLIEFLRHEKAAIRNLAAWHLIRLAPEGKKIPFNPSSTPADQEAAYTAWKKLIPAGQLPPVPRKNEK